MKSALEIALERTKDIVPQNDPNELSDEAKSKIREINKEFDVRIAEIEVKASSKARELMQSYSEKELEEILPAVKGQSREVFVK
ncbi:MAG TPA: hypothetical protein PLQ76_05600, partial [bacterium]|nr:hypothetical protein [bacterium]